MDKGRWICVLVVEEGRTGQAVVEEPVAGRTGVEAAEAAAVAAAAADAAAAVWAGVDDRLGGMKVDCMELVVLDSVALVVVDGRLQVREVG